MLHIYAKLFIFMIYVMGADGYFITADDMTQRNIPTRACIELHHVFSAWKHEIWTQDLQNTSAERMWFECVALK